MNEEKLEDILGAVYRMLTTEGATEAAILLKDHPAILEQTGYDNWNGGTDIWEIRISLPVEVYTSISSRKNHIEEQISVRLKTVMETRSQDWYSAVLIPDVEENTDWRINDQSNIKISRQTRLNIFDGIRLENIIWYGELNDVEFLSELYDLESLPSFDNRFPNAARDIWQHTINNDDWEPDWIYTDTRFNLLTCPEEEFLKFLCKVVSPLVRPDRDESLKLVSHFNDQLKSAGWEIVEVEKIAGRPRFAYVKNSQKNDRSVTRARSVADALNAGWMAKEIERLEHAVDNDPALAIGTAKDLVESCCKTILIKRNVTCSKSDDIGTLTKKLTKELRLVPEGISEEAKGANNIRLILRGLTQITHNLAMLRGLYGTGHGRDGQYRGLQPRHARLAVGTAVAFIDFVSETYRQRNSDNETDN